MGRDSSFPVPAVPHLEVADTFLKRAIGLLGRSSLPCGHGLLIPRCRSIHTFLMRFPIDVIFFDNNRCIVKVVRGLKPWRIAYASRQATSVIEVQSGWIPPLAEGQSIQ